MEEGHDSGANNDNSASHNNNYEEGEAGSPLTHGLFFNSKALLRPATASYLILERTAQRAQRVAPSSVAPPSPQNQGITPQPIAPALIMITITITIMKKMKLKLKMAMKMKVTARKMMMMMNQTPPLLMVCSLIQRHSLASYLISELTARRAHRQRVLSSLVASSSPQN